MLTTQWTTLCIALAQALLLRHRLPVAFWPAAAVMLAGAAMVIAPSVGQVRAPGYSAHALLSIALPVAALL